ncbi:MAG: hypothetical protein E7368_02160, partial [Clostridiales bacterium]|nr:hypothetical protein [Clostridiales bacterium]
MSRREEKRKKTNANRKESGLVTKESLCAVGALFSALAFLILCTNEALFGESIGGSVFDFLIGVFGVCAYPLFLGTFYLCGTSLIGKRFIKNRKAFAFFLLGVCCLLLIIHVGATYSWGLDGYVARCFNAPMAEGTVTVAGWMGALIVYALSAVTTKIGAIIILAVCMLFLAYLSYITFKNGEVAVEKKAKKTENGGSAYGAPVEIPLTQQSQQSETIMQDAPTTQPSYTQPTYASETA